MVNIFKKWIVELGAAGQAATVLAWVAVVVILALLAILSNYIVKKLLLKIVAFLIRKSKTNWDDALLERKVFDRLSHIAPALVVYFAAPVFTPVAGILERLSIVYMIVVGVLVIDAFLNAVVDVYRSFEISKQKPIKGYVQVAKVIIVVLFTISALAVLMDRSPILLLSGFGAMTAVILLVFKDSILGLVASIQLSANDMVRIGDWIEMPKYGADGDVIDITLNTVKVQNWDKTITTIPSYSLISDSFKNWRGMADSGGRRIKRPVMIDITSIRLCTDEMLDRFEKFMLIAEYVKSKRTEVAEYNVSKKIDTSELINGRRLTNIGTFRAYVAAYLRAHPKIHNDMTFLVRQLPPGEHGLPLEIYVFSNDQEWANYEAIQADIFDHILAVLPMFDLRIFQQPTGSDFRALSSDREIPA